MTAVGYGCNIDINVTLSHFFNLGPSIALSIITKKVKIRILGKCKTGRSEKCRPHQPIGWGYRKSEIRKNIFRISAVLEEVLEYRYHNLTRRECFGLVLATVYGIRLRY